jgi:cardiolipin synthase A/B
MGNKYIVFDEPEKSFKRIFQLIESAKKSIYIETYRFSNDSIGRNLLDLLIKKSEKGLDVILIVDSLGWGRFSKQRRKKLDESSIKLYIFNPIFNKFSFSKIKKYWNIHFRNHRKLTIIDKKIAFVGGTNYSAKELNWRDLFVEITGPIVKDLEFSAREMQKIAVKKHFQKRIIFKKLSKRFSKEDILVRQIPYSKHRLLKKELIKIFNSAKEEILIATPYLVPDLPFRRALKNARKRGIKINILIPKNADGYFASMMNHFGCYLAHKSKINVYLSPKMIHSKFVIVDNNVCTFGSANLDYQTFNHNYELNIISENKSLIKQLKKSFFKDLKTSKLYEEKNWSKRIWMNRVIMSFLIKHKRHF